MRVLLTGGLVLVWAMPVVVAVQVWLWMTNFQNGIVNYVLTQLHLGDFSQHDWYETTFSKLAMVTLLIVWGAIPFVTITVYAGLAQVPHELVEAAEIDGAGPLRVFRDVTFPVLKPILLILTSLSIIWDFGVFAQPYLMIGASHLDVTNYVMGVYVFIEGYAHSDFGRGATISLLDGPDGGPAFRSLYLGDGAGGGQHVSTVAPTAAGHPRPRERPCRGRRRFAGGGVSGIARVGWNVVGLLVFAVLVFPVFWMVSTAFKPDVEINGFTPTWFSTSPTLDNFRDATDAVLHPGFWTGVKNSLIVVGITLVLSIVLAFVAAVALAKYSFTGRRVFVVLMIAILMLPQVGLIIPLYVVLARYGLLDQENPLPTGALAALILTYLTFLLPFAIWTLRGFILGVPRELEEAAMVDGSSRLGAFLRILLPLVAPGLVATSVFVFITVWNEFIFANVILSSQSNHTLTVWLASFSGSSRNTDWGALMAASTLTAIPVIIFFLLVQRKIAFNLTAGSVKG